MQTIEQSPINSNNFIVGAIGIIASLIMAIFGLEAWYMAASIIMVGALLYDTDFFAIGIIGFISIAIFSALNWFPMFMYWTIVLILGLVIAVKIVYYIMRNI